MIGLTKTSDSVFFRILFVNFPLWFNPPTHYNRIEVPEITSAEQPCFRVLTFFSADSENTQNTSADQWCFRSDQFWFCLNQRCSELKNSVLNNAVSERISSDSALIYSESALILTRVDYNIKFWRSQKMIKIHKVVNKIAFQVFKRFKFSQFSAELQQKLKFSATILKVQSTKRENAIEN